MNKSHITPNPAEPGVGVSVDLIQAARQRAFQAVNTAMMDLYWQIGEQICRRIAAAERRAA